MAASALRETGGGEPPLKFSGNGKFPLNSVAAVFLPPTKLYVKSVP